jgi:hypothetical protein
MYRHDVDNGGVVLYCAEFQRRIGFRSKKKNLADKFSTLQRSTDTYNRAFNAVRCYSTTILTLRARSAQERKIVALFRFSDVISESCLVWPTERRKSKFKSERERISYRICRHAKFSATILQRNTLIDQTRQCVQQSRLELLLARA